MNVEALLREALAPVEPPPALLSEQIETRLATLAEAAQEELEGWELATMRDPATGAGRWPPQWSRPRPGRHWWPCASVLATVRARSSPRPCATSPSAPCRTSPKRLGAYCRIWTAEWRSVTDIRAGRQVSPVPTAGGRSALIA